MEPRDGLALSTRFLEAYNRLDDFMRRTLNARPGVIHSQLLVEMVKRDALFRSSRYDLDVFARLRNAIVHSPLASDSKAIAEPHPDVVQKYERLVSSLLEPPLASTVAVPLEKIFSAEWSDQVLRVVEMMQEKVYTHVPILENGIVVGVFSESTFLSVLAGRRQIAMDDATTLSDLRGFVPLSGGVSEVIGFISANASVAEVALRFQLNFKEGKRLGALFLTGKGDPTEQLCGLITAWDVAGLLVG
jgi:CBS domain-containing protein